MKLKVRKKKIESGTRTRKSSVGSKGYLSAYTNRTRKLSSSLQIPKVNESDDSDGEQEVKLTRTTQSAASSRRQRH